ncbi:hypothetical protein TUMSATVNIG1_59590 (plasmid) [Vibrio nigripulchritudo]|uniref:hypothetical protein n=1 Tax=Vibrio nigripulchritudo TaxID=28173 RepID=UPI001909D520|nr:hypothetical protein [Vibrio nigripulchritudo]BDU35350.1 hypothetical protein TUMSATVNIG1_59590 [Vibrio nigripulchritudo]
MSLTSGLMELVSKKRKEQVASAVRGYREKQKETGRKQTPLMLSDEDRSNMAKIKQNEDDVSNQGEAVSKALSEYVKKYD